MLHLQNKFVHANCNCIDVIIVLSGFDSAKLLIAGLLLLDIQFVPYLLRNVLNDPRQGLVPGQTINDHNHIIVSIHRIVIIHLEKFVRHLYFVNPAPQGGACQPTMQFPTTKNEVAAAAAERIRKSVIGPN